MTGMKPWAFGAPSQQFDYRVGVKDTGQDPQIQQATFEYFDALFAGIEDTIGISMNDVLEKHGKLSVGSSGSIQALSNDMFSALIGNILYEMFPDVGTITQEYEYRTGRTIKSFGGREGTTIVRHAEYKSASREISALAEHLTNEFFQALAPEGGLWEGFGVFADVANQTEGFVDDLTRRIFDLGQTAEDAFGQIQLVSGVLAEMDMAIAQITGTQITAQINALSDTWNAYIDVMTQAQATAEQLTAAEQKKNTVIGANITGLTASSIQSTITSGGNISGMLQSTMQQLMAGSLAEDIVNEYILPLNEMVGEVWQETGGDIEAVLAAIQGYDLSGANADIKEFEQKLSELFGGSAGYTTPDWMDNFVSALDLLGHGSTATRVQRNDVLKGMEESLRPLQEFVWALEDGAESIENATSGLDTVRGTTADILGGNQTPQSREFFEGRYNDLLADAQRNPENVSAFTDFATKYLDFISDYGDPKAQEDVLKDLFSLEGSLEEQVSLSENITGGKTIYDLYMLIDQIAGQGTFWEQTNPAASFAGGGVISGPMSGYTVPVTFHGKEHISTDSDMKDVKSLLQAIVSQSQSGNGTVRVYVKVGDSGEFREVVADVMRSDPETQEITRRVVNG
jgi:hypothetical protein